MDAACRIPLHPSASVARGSWFTRERIPARMARKLPCHRGFRRARCGRAGSHRVVGLNEAPPHLRKISRYFPENPLPKTAIDPIVQSFYISLSSAIVCVRESV